MKIRFWRMAGMDGVWTPEVHRRKRLKISKTLGKDGGKIKKVAGRRRKSLTNWCLGGCVWTFLIWGAAGQQIEGLEGSWWMRKSMESEVLAAVALVSLVTQQLEVLETQPSEKGHHRRMYIAAGRALRLADATQNYLMGINEKRKVCQSCTRNPKS